jgi:hypothetical protein
MMTRGARRKILALGAVALTGAGTIGGAYPGDTKNLSSLPGSIQPPFEHKVSQPDTILVTGDRGSRPSRWLRAESQNFIVYGNQPENDLREQVVLLEQFDATLRILTGVTAPPPANRLEIYLVADQGNFGRISLESRGLVDGSRNHDTEHGFYSASPTGTLAALNLSYAAHAGQGRSDDWLLHEYTHHFVLQHDPLAMFPAWYSEGFAEYMCATEIDGDLADLGVAPALLQRFWRYHDWRWDPQLIFRRDSYGLLNSRSGEQPLSFLTRSWVLTHLILSDANRWEAFRKFLVEFRTGRDPQAAFAAAFGMSPRDLGPVLREYARRLRGVRVRLPSVPDRNDINVTSLPSSADLVLLPYGALKRGTSNAELLRAIVERVRGAATQRPDSLSMRALVFAELEIGNPAAAEQPLRLLTASSPNDPELLYLAGLSRLVTARAGSGSERLNALRVAKEWLAQAQERNPDHYPTHFRSAEVEFLVTGEANEDVRNMLLRAVQLAPQVATIRIAAALVLLARGETTQVRELLEPIIGSIHNPAAPRAVDVMQLLASGRRPGLDLLASAFTAR